MRESVVWSKSVRVTELKVPSTAIFGESVTLICSYDLGSEELYVVKWYKDDLEFYRYEPKDDNQSVYFPQPGIDIDSFTNFSPIRLARWPDVQPQVSGSNPHKLVPPSN
ncbi:uncharacterized protein CDAR_498521 [Caerostris darwini]|uniref:Ig-like domain-containing protein n=1 Tax=Caerostris darwini TaxID=1538125 RepID=A0AAV4SPP2_9ARAC|nr:uncharacterized protein CDAR_498521 [Caerostris darwini]